MSIPNDPALDAAIVLARRFLALFEARDIAAAAALVHPETVYVFPGGVRRTDLAEVAAGSSKRYARIGKTIEACDAHGADGAIIVYVRGTLHGAWPDGEAFSGIRFIDRFEIVDGLITRQDVWNDAGEFRPRP